MNKFSLPPIGGAERIKRSKPKTKPMAKKTTNQFNAPSEGVQSGAPEDEKPATAVKLNKDGSTRKVRGPSGPRTVNPKIEEFRAAQKQALYNFESVQKADREAFFKQLSVETDEAKVKARMEKKLLALSPAEQAWLDKQVADKLAAAGAPEPEQQP